MARALHIPDQPDSDTPELHTFALDGRGAQMRKLVILAALLAFGATMVGCHADAGGDTHGASVDVH